MRKFLIIAATLMMITACNNRPESNQAEEAINNEMAQVEEAQDETSDEVSNKEGQDGWMKQNTIKSSKPMVVDFFATWCGPCKQLAPILDEIEQHHKGEVIFERIDVDQNPDLAQEFNIQAIPMLMFITPTGEYQTIVGLEEPAVIESKIAELLTRSAK